MKSNKNNSITLLLAKILLVVSVFGFSGYYNHSCASPQILFQTELVLSEKSTITFELNKGLDNNPSSHFYNAEFSQDLSSLFCAEKAVLTLKKHRESFLATKPKLSKLQFSIRRLCLHSIR